MEKFLKFKGSWRSYQKRILDNLETHLSDEKLHIVAAPGAGKTTLGLETISRLNKPCLILCPTNTIKNQWKNRIYNAFLESSDRNFVSTNIKRPEFITIITYQALLSTFSGKELAQEDFEENNEELTSIKQTKQKIIPTKANEIIEILKKKQISVLCFDEAHHLRNEWWKALTYLVDELKPTQTIALTGTPPYDATPEEWGKYENLCGPIDETISIPELVKNNDLCPHQDFIHFSNLSKSESDMIRNYNAKLGQFLGKIFSDKQLFLYLRSMSFLQANDNEVEKILENPDFYISIVSLLSACGCSIPKQFLKLFDTKEKDIPKFNIQRTSDFLNGLFFSERKLFTDIEPKIQEYENLARHLGLLDNNKIALIDNSKLQKQISHSIGKLDSIIEIVKLEYETLSTDLRMVILTDYIKENTYEPTTLGVIPILKKLSDKFSTTINYGVLTGSIILIPATLQEVFENFLKLHNLNLDSITITNYKNNENYIKITPKESSKNYIVEIITEIFNKGYINILIGTQALLGEGWDAPSINSLILSSTVSSYMLSNQMRGRAIRKDANNPYKVSNIWHLASVKIPKINEYDSTKIINYDENHLNTVNYCLYDLKQLEKRFEGFEAPSYFEKSITNGISRVINESTYVLASTNGEYAFLELNNKTMERAKNRAKTIQEWKDSLYLGFNAYNTTTVGLNTPNQIGKSLTYKTLLSAFLEALASYIAFVILLLPGITQIFIISYTLGITLLLLGLFGICAFYGIKYLMTGTIDAVMKQIAIVNFKTAHELDLINCSEKNVDIRVQKTLDKNFYIKYGNISTEYNNFLIKNLAEILDPIENPRYLLIRKKEIIPKLYSQTDYFAVPTAYSSRKADVNLYKQNWEKLVGRCEIIYTRNLNGRKTLLKARKQAFSNLKRERTKKLTKWQ